MLLWPKSKSVVSLDQGLQTSQQYKDRAVVTVYNSTFQEEDNLSPVSVEKGVPYNLLEMQMTLRAMRREETR